ncbi:MAG: ferrochelatase [Bacteroidota bacterium]
MARTAVVLLQLGGPDTLDAVEPFLYNLFCDPDIIDVPGAFFFRKPLARLISRKRSPAVRELYKSIGGRSPILPQTQMQADALKKKLASQGVNIPVHIAMRYWHPMTDEVVRDLVQSDVDRAILVPLYPHFSSATTGSSVNEWKRALYRLGTASLRYDLVRDYHDHPLFIDAWVARIHETLGRFSPEERAGVTIVFSAHGTPMKLVRQGDPYSHQIRKTVELVVERGRFGLPHTLCFQSKVGPQRWLEPSLIDAIVRLGTEGVKRMVVVPIAFVTEHIETLSEINIEARHLAASSGVRQYEMTKALLSQDSYISCLAELTMQRLNGASA